MDIIMPSGTCVYESYSPYPQQSPGPCCCILAMCIKRLIPWDLTPSCGGWNSQRTLWSLYFCEITHRTQSQIFTLSFPEAYSTIYACTTHTIHRREIPSPQLIWLIIYQASSGSRRALRHLPPHLPTSSTCRHFARGTTTTFIATIFSEEWTMASPDGHQDPYTSLTLPSFHTWNPHTHRGFPGWFWPLQFQLLLWYLPGCGKWHHQGTLH